MILDNNPKYPTDEEFETLFWLAFSSINVDIQKTLKDWWKTHGDENGNPYIFIDPWKWTGETNYAHTRGIYIHFNLEYLMDKKISIFEIIFHEVGHCYYLATNQQSIYEYKKKYARYEKEADRFARSNMKTFRRNSDLLNEIRALPVFQKLQSLVNVSPL